MMQQFVRINLGESIGIQSSKGREFLTFMKEQKFKNYTPLFFAGAVYAVVFEDSREAMRFKLSW